MTFDCFASLSDEDKNKYLFSNGTLLYSRQEPKFIICLYAVEGFYVEVFYHIKSNEINYMRSFTCSSYLDPYLKNIDISGLLN